MSKRIVSITVHRDVDCDPDLSFLGEYSASPGENAIDRQARGDCERGHYRYCNITMSADETGNPESVEQDYQRLEAYNRGDWCMVGVYATAEVVLAGGVVQRVRSGGLWGIESDSNENYLKSVEDEQRGTGRAAGSRWLNEKTNQDGSSQRPLSYPPTSIARNLERRPEMVCLQCLLPLEATEATEPFCSSDCKNEFLDDLISDKEELECLVSTDF